MTGTGPGDERAAGNGPSGGEASGEVGAGADGGIGGAARPPVVTGRRELAYAVVACLGGAGLALFAATHTWAERETVRAAPLPPLIDTSTGGDLAPWLPPLALVGLAGAGAVLATRGAGRAFVGLLVSVCGLAVLAGAGRGIVDGTAAGWPALAGLGGVLLVGGGVAAVLRGRHWPAMGARYDARRPGGGTAGYRAGGPAGDSAAGPADASAGAPPGRPAREGHRRPTSDTLDTWNALDRGEDPTLE